MLNQAKNKIKIKKQAGHSAPYTDGLAQRVCTHGCLCGFDLWHGGFASLSRAIADLGREPSLRRSRDLLVMLWLLMRYEFPSGAISVV